MPDINSYNLIMFIGMLPKKKHQQIQRLKCKNKSSSPKDVIYSLVLTAIQI